MGKQKDAILILGEGPTEFFYFNSLKDEFPGLTIKPDTPKNTNLKDLEKKIDEGISLGYRYIFCVIDMDTKGKEAETKKYKKLKKKYEKPISKPKDGILCDVKFFETHLCTELFFLYYFRYTSRPYDNQDTLFEDLHQYCPYEKTIKFFKQCKGLHPYFEKKGGSLDKAIENAKRSMDDKQNSDRDYTYSELGQMLEMIKALFKIQPY